ncbi:hypothetical protein PsAD13_05159 [Pseudovibrio sp. Ad13]|uniref:GDSL-type esterase/lipase family protein n=1 Tax=Pseudovibrio sp. Ad13 TaxID=989396 RepID=UPI0007AE999B|nr:GDSL-type esterase/lipase family protein [Pseudovibrio sp. Ad13]KZK79043.1 hypothetical protein PsAD13_05159 [Pseudovibrio sp. Ad13]
MTYNVLVYGDSNTWGWKGVEVAFPSSRYADNERWAGVLAAELGDKFKVSVDGLTVRSTNLDEPAAWNSVPADAFNGGKNLPAAIAREMPLDLVVIMLGTNDLKNDLARSAEDIADAIIEVAKVAKGTEGGVAYTYRAPEVLVISPPPVSTMAHPDFALMFEGGQEKSRKLGAALKAVANAAGIESFDASVVIPKAAGLDGLHMSAEQHKVLGRAVAKKIHVMADAAVD